MNKIRLAAGLLLSILALSCHKDPATEEGNGGGKSDRFSVTVSLPQNAGKAAWTKSDRIRLYIQDGSLSAPSATLSSEGEGASATFSASSVKNGTEYWLLYPQGATIIAGTMSAYAMIPGVQKAVAGGVDDDAFLMGGRTEKRSGSVPMEALCALVKFTLSGDGVSSVRKVTLSSDDYMAGDVSISGFGGLMATKSDPTRERAGQLKEVTLTGPFQSGSSYCFSVIPGAINLPVRLTFEDGQGRTQRVESLASFSAGNPMDLGNIEVKEFTEPSAFEALFTATKEGIKPYVIVFMADGFTEAERSTYQQAAEAAVDFMFSVQPFREFKEYFSAYVGWKASKESGPGQTWGTVTTGGGMGSYGQARRNAIYDWINQQCPEVKSGKTPLDNVGVFMLVNNTSYLRPVCDWENNGRFVTPVGLKPNWSATASLWGFGGTWGNYEWRDGGKHVLTDAELTELGYARFGSTWAVDGDYRNECLHEGLGHGFTRLMDEYWYGDKVFPDCTYGNVESYYHVLDVPTGWNISSSATENPWKALDASREDLVKADARYGRIGTYEGGLSDVLRGVWRSEKVSVMMDNRPYFSTWQRALVYQRLMRVSGENPSCDVRQAEDLQKYLEIDKRIGGIADPKRDE